MNQSEIKSLLPSYLVNSSMYSIVVTNLTGQYVYVNDFFKQRFSFLNTDFVGDSVSIAIHPDDLEKCGKVAERCLENPDLSYPIQIRKPSEARGEYIWTNWEYSLLQDKQQKPVGILCVGYDATNEGKFIQKLAETETLLKAMYDSTSDACSFIDPQFRFLFLNQLAKENCLQLFNRIPVAGDDIFDFFYSCNHAEFKGYFERILQGKSIKIEKEDEIGFWWVFSMFPVYDVQNKIVGIAMNVRDITERKQNEIKIIQQNERLKQITWQHSHEVRRHIVNMMGLHDLIKNSSLLSDNEKQDLIESLLKETRQLDMVVHAIVERSIGLKS